MSISAANAFKSVLVLIFLVSYYKIMSPHIPAQLSVWLNLGAIPALAGILIWVLMKGDGQSYILPIVLPLVVLISITVNLKGDPAVPGLQYWVSGIMSALYVIGLLVAYGIKKVISL